MSFNDIIVYVDGTAAAKARVAVAVALAKEQDAHLVGIAFAPNALLPLCGADVGFADMSGVLRDVKTQGETALKSFEACAAVAGVSAEGRLMQGMSEMTEDAPQPQGPFHPVELIAKAYGLL